MVVVVADSSPYTITFDKSEVLMLPKIFLDVGQSTQSPYCIERDGYKKYGSSPKPYRTIDYDNTMLRYNIGGLYLDKNYQLDVSYYFRALLSPVEPQELYPDTVIPYGRVTLVLLVDSIPLDTSVVNSNNLVRVSVGVPSEAVADSEIIIDVKKIRGAPWAVCGEIGLYEFNQSSPMMLTQGGTQGDESAYIGSFFIYNIYPNPAKNILKVRLNSPNERRVVVKLYDVTGRLIETYFDGMVNIGMNEIAIKSDKLSTGVYFVNIEAEEELITRKAIFLR